MGRESECICGGTSRRWVVQGSAGGASRKLSYIQTSGGTNVRVRTLLNLLSLLNPCGALTLYTGRRRRTYGRSGCVRVVRVMVRVVDACVMLIVVPLSLTLSRPRAY